MPLRECPKCFSEYPIGGTCYTCAQDKALHEQSKQESVNESEQYMKDINSKIKQDQSMPEYHNYSEEFLKKITVKYPHNSDCPCVECEQTYLHNMDAIANTYPCSSCGEPAKKLLETSKNAFCNECTQKALDNAFKTLQTSLSIDIKTGKHSDKIPLAEIQKAKLKMEQSNPLK
jgi:DNA-directed RNA polymerase subunit RPC12/RpoP